MIYNKPANFAHPILSNDKTNYKNSIFDLDVDLSEMNNKYVLKISSVIGSNYIKWLLQNKKASMFLVIKSKDNKIFKIVNFDEDYIQIDKKKISFQKNTMMQLFIKSDEDISFENNNDLENFYDEFKDQIVLPKGYALAFSSTQRFDGNIKEPFKIFKRELDKNMEVDIDFQITDEFINIKHRNNSVIFADVRNKSNLLNMYYYNALTKVLLNMILDYGDDNGELYTVSLGHNLENLSPLECKIYKLILSKDIENMNVDIIDYVIQKISDDLIGKFASDVNGGNNDN